MVLAEAGYDVCVFRGPSLPSLSEQENALNSRLGKAINIVPVDWNIEPKLRTKSAIAQRSFRAIHRFTGLFARYSYTRLYAAFESALRDARADLFIAHNLTALPVTVLAAKRMNARVAFDAEDFHSGQFNDDEQSSYDCKLTLAIERRYIPQCNQLTAASEGIADAYTSMLGISKPTVLLNVFPLEETTVRLPEDQAASERPTAVRSIYWFSQTVGPERGLETAVKALAHLPDDTALVVRGVWAPGYHDQLFSMAKSLNVDTRVHYRAPAPPEKMIAYAACHDIGLALENSLTRNRDICVTNKLFTFLAGATPCILTNTQGQRPFAMELTKSTRLIPQNAPSELARAALSLLEHHVDAKNEARYVTHRKYNWNLESSKLLDAVARVMCTSQRDGTHEPR